MRERNRKNKWVGGLLNKCIARDQKQIIFYKKKKECMKFTEKKTVLTIGYEASTPQKKKKNKERGKN